MNNKNYAGVVINNVSIQTDKIFTYKIPDKFKEKIEVGYRIKVPFGKGNKAYYGFVFDIYENCNNINNIKDITSICDSFPMLTSKDIDLICWMRKRYLCSYIDCIKLFIPTGVISGVKEKLQYHMYIGKPLEGRYIKDNYKYIYDIVKKYNGQFTKSDLAKDFSLSLSSINTLIKYNFLYTEEQRIQRYNNKEYTLYPAKVLNEYQKNASDIILNSEMDKFLLHGVTGSGKTEIYMNLVSSMIQNKKDSIILVPEISLTPQIVERFKGRFGSSIAVFHSRLSSGERYDEWFRVKERKVKVAIGARSALFLPFHNLGLIVIDEEHETSYKSESNPKYNAREVAEIMCLDKRCKLVLGSATPSIDTYYNAKNGKFKLIRIDKRADGALMPHSSVIDMRDELIKNNKSIISSALYEAISDRLNKKEQVIIFLNRRGFSPFVSCRKCGYVFRCSKCDISLTYHDEDKSLTCHYCGIKRKMPSVCPKCGSKYIKYFGIGTERLEQEIKKFFPSSRILRMDADSTRRKNSFENIYYAFKNNTADILIGTQMIAKGLDFPNVTLVGIIAADLSLNMPDYRSSERTFQLITQVSGRSGRGKKHGEVIIQTYSPDNYSIRYSKDNAYDKFYEEEIKIRKNMDYPPFSKILCINLSSKNEQLLIKRIMKLGERLKSEYNDCNLLGPCPCEISKIKDMFRWQIIIKQNFDLDFANSIKNMIYDELKDVYNDIRINIDINPNSLL